MLAEEIERQRRTDDVNLALMSWLRTAVQSDYFPAKVELAWELAASTTPGLRDPDEALALVSQRDTAYFDRVRILETQAAAYARTGNFKKAVKLQKKALKEAESLEWSIPVMSNRLGFYTLGKAWAGPYYVKQE